MGLLDCGFTLEVVEEDQTSEKMLEIPGMKDEMRYPMMLLVRAKKKTARGNGSLQKEQPLRYS